MLPLLIVVAISSACVSSGMASVTRPHSVYAAPRAAAMGGEPESEIHCLTDTHRAFERGQSPGQVALAEGQQTEPPRSPHEARGMIRRLGNLEPFVPDGPALSEPAELGVAPGEPGTGPHGRQ